MNMTRPRRLLAICVAAWAASAHAEWPDKPIRLVVPYAAGSATDLVARQIMPKIGIELRQTIVIDNKAGASGIIGAQEVAKAPADGYTLLFGGIQTNAINATLYDKLPYDPVRDFAPVARLDTQPLLLAVNAKLGIKSVPELIQYAKSHRNSKLSYASTGSGTSAHLANEMFNRETGVQIQHVPYRSVPQALIDLSNGDLTMFFYTYAPLLPFLQKNAITVLATTNLTRMSALPDLPTMTELGLPKVSISAWQALYAPKGTPREIVDAIQRAAATVMKDPELKNALSQTGTEVWFGNVQETTDFTNAEIARMGEVVRASGAKPD